MEWLLAFAVVIIVVQTIKNFRDKKKYSDNSEIPMQPLDTSVEKTKYPYHKKDFFFSQTERSFFQVLSSVLAETEYYAFSKVRLADLLNLSRGTKDKITYWNKIRSKHADFVICDKKWYKPLLLIELDDSSHNSDTRISRDSFVEKALSDAGLPLLRIVAKHSYSALELTNKLGQHISINGGEADETSQKHDEKVVESETPI